MPLKTVGHMKETFYFQHDYNAKDDPKALELRAEYGAEGYGVFWMLLETMASEETGYLNREAIGGLSVAYAIPKDRLKLIIDYCIKIGLFIAENNTFYSKRMIEHKEMRKAFSEAGKKGANARWNNSPPNSHPNDTPNAKERKGKEIKEEENKENNNIFNFKKSLISLGVNENYVNDWMQVRNKKKASNTETAFNGFISKVKEAGINVNDAVKICAENSWVGFNKDWIKNMPTTETKKERYIKYLDNGYEMIKPEHLALRQEKMLGEFYKFVCYCNIDGRPINGN